MRTVGPTGCPLPLRAFTPKVFPCRLRLPQLPAGRLAGRDIIDAGAFAGDGAVVLLELIAALAWPAAP